MRLAYGAHPGGAVSTHITTPLMRSLLFAALVLVAAPLASAQATFGLKAGLNTSFFSGDDADGLDAKLGAVGGATVRFDVNPGFGVGVEALYSQKGARYEDPLDADFDESYHFDYVEIPAYVRLAVPLGDYLEGGVSLGGYVGIPVSSKVTGDLDDSI